MIQRGKYNYDSEYWNSISASKTLKKKYILQIKNFVILAAKNLIDHLLIVDRHKRLSAEEILLHPWIMTSGQSKSIRNTEELKTTLRIKYDAKIKEYAMENNAP
jgi:serine/threonine protein kinase